MANAPKLGGIDTSRSKANTTDARLNALVPNMASDLSPTYIYTPSGVVELQGSGATVPDYGWTCPDGITEVQVECYGAGGGGGGGTTGVGGGGGGGGEYACEPNYPVVPGETYSYYVAGDIQGGNAAALATSSGDSLLPGGNGADAHFDFRGKGITGGVLAHGGQGGDQDGVGVAGRGGTGSVNSIHFNGGDGGTSAAGMMSDNPIRGTTNSLASTVLWYRLNDSTTGSLFARDFSSSNRPSVIRIRNTGAVVTPTSEVTAPLQAPFGAGTTWDGNAKDGETQGNCWKFDHGTGSGYIGGIQAPSFTLQNMTQLTVSCWIKGLPAAVSSGDWGDNLVGQKILVGNTDLTASNNNGNGFCLYLNLDTSTLSFRIKNSVTGTTNSCPMPSANDGNWHMCTAVYQAGTNGMKMYVDGVLQNTITSGAANVAAGSQPIVMGMNKATLSQSFKGYMSNAWISTVAESGTYIAQAYGASPATGGSGGGASGGSAGAGNGGTGAVGSGGGAAGASAAASNPGINNGSCAGGAGGASGSNGSDANLTGPPTGGGGGGSGADATVTPTYTAYLPCNMSGSYTGYDAQGNAGGQLYTVSADPQADVTSPWYSTAAQRDSTAYSGGRADSPFQGSMFSVLTFPSFASVNGSIPAGGGQPFMLNDSHWTIDGLYLRLTVNTPNAANMALAPWYANQVASSLPSDHTSMVAAGMGPITQYAYIPDGDAGRQVTLDLFDSSLGSTFVARALSNGFGGQGVGLLLGQLHGSLASDPITTTAFGAFNDDEAPDWYCAFTGADNDPTVTATLIVKYHATATSNNHGGQGSPGYIVITFINPQGTPVATVLPASTTDAAGNAFAAGFTGQNNAWQPGSSPKVVETWHSASLSSGFTGTLKYKYTPWNSVRVVGLITEPATAANPFYTLPAGWRPASSMDFPVGVHAAPTGGPFIRVGTDGTLQVLNANNAAVYIIDIDIPLDY